MRTLTLAAVRKHTQRELAATCECVGEAPAARIGGSNVQQFLLPKAKNDRRVCGHLITGSDRLQGSAGRVVLPRPKCVWA
jgi:hypothetical protein